MSKHNVNATVNGQVDWRYWTVDHLGQLFVSVKDP